MSSITSDASSDASEWSPSAIGLANSQGTQAIYTTGPTSHLTDIGMLELSFVAVTQHPRAERLIKLQFMLSNPVDSALIGIVIFNADESTAEGYASGHDGAREAAYLASETPGAADIQQAYSAHWSNDDRVTDNATDDVQTQLVKGLDRVLEHHLAKLRLGSLTTRRMDEEADEFAPRGESGWFM